MTDENKNLIIINNVKYNAKDFDKTQLYYAAQIKDLQNKSNTTKFQLDQITMSLNSFTKLLTDTLENKTKEVQ
tara:strand:- start:85 stop:303 length:219 start_codon:yes stop_codon:yes gene_type:complete